MKKMLYALPLLLLGVAVCRADTYVMDMSTGEVSLQAPLKTEPIANPTFYLDVTTNTVSTTPASATPTKSGCSCSVCNCPDGQCPSCPLAAKVKTAVTIPPGFHAHTKEDGTVIVHSDKNKGKAGPHEGVAHPWHKSGYAGDTVLVDVNSPSAEGSIYTVLADPCPNGVCPRGVSRTTSTSSTSGQTFTTGSSTTTRARAAVRSAGPVRRIFGAVFRGRCRG